DLQALVPLLQDAQQVRLAGFKKGQDRKYIEVREFALMAAKRMIRKNPGVMKNGRVTGYCPIKRFVGLDIISQPERWEEIENVVDQWLVEFDRKR
ncbi:MAG: hypothetical protein AAF492_27225, partial [Verrucomicrobiota bacterium]